MTPTNKSSRRVWFTRNEQAEALELEGKEEEARALYEANVAEGCDISFTYERLAALYRRQERFDDELEALRRALEIEERRGPTAQVLRLRDRIVVSQQVQQRSREVRSVGRDRPSAPPVMRSNSAQPKKRKGCLSVVVLLAAAATLAAALG